VNQHPLYACYDPVVDGWSEPAATTAPVEDEALGAVLGMNQNHILPAQIYIYFPVSTLPQNIFLLPTSHLPPTSYLLPTSPLLPTSYLSPPTSHLLPPIGITKVPFGAGVKWITITIAKARASELEREWERNGSPTQDPFPSFMVSLLTFFQLFFFVATQ